MAEIINGVPIGDLPGIESVPDDSMLVVEFLGKAYHMPGAVLRQMIQDVLDSMGDSVDDVTEARLTAAIETVLSSGKYNGVSPSVEVLDEEDGTTVIHIIDAFGDKRYPVEVKGATDAVRYKPQSLTDAQKAQARANIGALSAADISDKVNEIVIVKISGSFDAGYTVLWGDLPAPAGGLNALVENGSIVIGIADGDLTFPLAGFDDYTVPSGTVFSYSPHDFSNNGTFWVNHVRDFQGMPDNKSCVLKSQSDGSVWTASVITEQYTFYLTGDYPGRILQYDGVQLLADRAFEILQDAVNNDAPIFCFQKDAAFDVEGGGTYTPPIGTPFYYNSEAGAFRCERDGFDCTLTVGMFGYTVIAEKTTPYKTAESKADDLKEEDGTLFLLSAGEPIGAGVPLPTGNADDCKIFIADLNTSTYEDIKAADDAGKICYALWGGYTACMLTTLSPESAIFTTLLDPHLGLYVKFTKGTVGVSDFGLTESHSVLYEPQSLTDAQKAQARANIDALSADDIEQVLQDVGPGNVYVARLFSAKYADIKAAYEAGKACFVTYGALLCPLTVLDEEKAEFVGMLTPHIGMKGTLYADGTYNFQYVHSNAVQTVEQSLTEEKKAQARANIGALSTDDVDTVLQQAKDSGKFDGKDGEDGEDGYTPVKGKDYFDGYTPVKGKDYFDGANGKSAYAYAQDGGYTGTEAEFAAKLASGSEPLKVTLSGNDTDGYTADKTVAEIYAARTAGRDVYMVGGAVTYQLSYLNGSFAAFSYTLASRNAIEIISVIMMSGVAPTRIHQTIDDSYVKYTAQSLDEEYKLQARTNIGAAAAADIAKTASLGISNSAAVYVKISDFGSWGTGAWHQKGFAMLITSRAGEMVWVAISSDDSNTNAKAIRLLNTYSKIAAIYYSVSESAVYVKANAWCNNINAHIISNINGDYVPTVAQASALPSDAVQITITEFGAGSGKTSIGDASRALGMTGSATRPTYNGADMALSSDLSGYLPLSGGLMAGSLKFQASSLPQKSLEFVCGIDSFANGGEMGWQSKAEFLNGYALKSDIPTNYAKLKTYNDFVHDGNEITMVPDGYSQGSLYFNYRTGAGQQNGNINNYLFCNGKGSTAGVTLTADAFSGTAARATADASGNNIANTYAKVTTANDYNGEQRFKNASYCPTITDTAPGIGCAFKSSRGLVNELLADKIIATASTGKIPFYSYTGASNGSMTGLTEFAYLSPGAFILRPPSGEGGQIQLEAAANDPTNTGICIDTAGGNFRIFGLQSADGTTTTGYGSVLAIHPYAKVITGGYSFDGIAARATADGNGRNIVSTYATKDEVVTAANGSLKVTLSGNDTDGYTVDKTFAEIKTAWQAGRYVYVTNGVIVCNPCYFSASLAAVFSYTRATGDGVEVWSVMVNNLGTKPTVVKKTITA